MSSIKTQRSRWSWKIGQLSGITIRVHATLLVLLAWVAVSYAIGGAGVREAALGVFLVALVFALVVVHELAHALVARRYGCKTREILLLPIGGLAQLDRMPARPRHELLVALAGPAVNVALALVIGVILVATGAPIDPDRAATISGALAIQLLWINIVLATFNLLPAFPMDGGRVLRALLAMRLGHARATRIASVVGRVLAGVFVAAGLFISPMLALVGVFVWLAAQQESAGVELRSILAGATVEQAMAACDDIPCVAPSDRLDAVIERVERAGAAFVVDDEMVIGLLTPEQLAAYAVRGADRPHPITIPVRAS